MWTQAFAAGMAGAAELLGALIELYTADEVSSLSVKWLDEITSTYMDRLARALTEGGAEDVKAVLEDAAHAAMIARTEISRARNAGAYRAYQSKRVKEVVWVTTSPDPCPECIENEAAGPWPLGRPFPSGAIMPPDHPHCACHLEPA